MVVVPLLSLLHSLLEREREREKLINDTSIRRNSRRIVIVTAISVISLTGIKSAINFPSTINIINNVGINETEQETLVATIRFQ